MNPYAYGHGPFVPFVAPPRRRAVQLAMDSLAHGEFARDSYRQNERIICNRMYVELFGHSGQWLAELREGDNGTIVRVRLEPYNG